MKQKSLQDKIADLQFSKKDKQIVKVDKQEK